MCSGWEIGQFNHQARLPQTRLLTTLSSCPLPSSRLKALARDTRIPASIPTASYTPRQTQQAQNTSPPRHVSPYRALTHSALTSPARQNHTLPPGFRSPSRTPPIRRSTPKRGSKHRDSTNPAISPQGILQTAGYHEAASLPRATSCVTAPLSPSPSTAGSADLSHKT